MPVQNLECQIHVVLMKRFLDGDELGPELQEQLEQHLKACPSCRAILENEKTSIEEVLDGPSAPANPVMAWMQSVMPGSKTRSGYAVTDAHSALMAPTTVHRPAPGMAAFKNPQVLMLSAALAVVLILMSTVFRDPTRFLGPKAAAKPAVATPAEGENKGGDAQSKETKTEETKAEGEASSSEEKSEGAVDPEPKPEPGTESAHADDHHAEEAHAPGEHAEGKSDPKPVTDATAAKEHGDSAHGSEGHEKDAEAGHTKESGAHGQEGHATAAKPAAKSTPKPTSTTRPDGTVVPGQRTLDKSEITVVGGGAARTPAAKPASQARPASTSGTARRRTASTAPRRRTETTRRSSSQRRPAARPTTSRPSQAATPRGSGVVVYDKNGNRLN